MEGKLSGLLKKVTGQSFSESESVEDMPRSESELLSREGGTFDPDLTLQRDTQKMFEKVAEYATLELQGTLSELQCLEQMNRVTAAKYSEMVSTAEGLGAFQQELRNKYKELTPVFGEIQEMEVAVTHLENITQKLDDYSKRLEEKAALLQKERASG